MKILIPFVLSIVMFSSCNNDDNQVQPDYRSQLIGRYNVNVSMNVISDFSNYYHGPTSASYYINIVADSFDNNKIWVSGMYQTYSAEVNASGFDIPSLSTGQTLDGIGFHNVVIGGPTDIAEMSWGHITLDGKVSYSITNNDVDLIDCSGQMKK